MRALVATTLVCLVACHETTVIDAPPRGTGRTGLWMVARSDVVTAGRVTCAPDPIADQPVSDGHGGTLPLEPCVEVYTLDLEGDDAPRVPAFARRGDVYLGYLELACSLEVLGLPEGLLTLREPRDESLMPRVKAAHAWSSGSASWAAVDATAGWIGATLRVLPVPDNLPCRTRGVEMRAIPLPQRTVSSLVPLAGGEVLIIGQEDTARFHADGSTETLILSSTTAPRLFGAGFVDEDGELWVVTENGRAHRTPLSDEMIARGDSSTIPSAWGRAASASNESFFVSTSLDVASSELDHGARSTVVRYDRAAARWDVVSSTTTPSDGILIRVTDMLPLDSERVLIAGADMFLNGTALTGIEGRGRLLEATRTSSTWYTLRGRGGGKVYAISVAETTQYGRVAGGIKCTNSVTCVDQGGVQGALFRQQGSEWVEIPGTDLEFAPFAITRATERSTWLGGLRNLNGGGSGVHLLFDDGLDCQPDLGLRSAVSVTRIEPIGTDSVLVVGYFGSSSTQTLLSPARVVEPDCIETAF